MYQIVGVILGEIRQQAEMKEYYGLKRKARKALKKNSIISKLCSQTTW